MADGQSDWLTSLISKIYANPNAPQYPSKTPRIGYPAVAQNGRDLPFSFPWPSRVATPPEMNQPTMNPLPGGPGAGFGTTLTKPIAPGVVPSPSPTGPGPPGYLNSTSAISPGGPPGYINSTSAIPPLRPTSTINNTMPWPTPVQPWPPDSNPNAPAANAQPAIARTPVGVAAQDPRFIPIQWQTGGGRNAPIYTAANFGGPQTAAMLAPQGYVSPRAVAGPLATQKQILPGNARTPDLSGLTNNLADYANPTWQSPVDIASAMRQPNYGLT